MLGRRKRSELLNGVTMPRTLLAVLALALCSLVSASAQAAFWLVPAGAQPPSVVAAALARAGVSADLVAVMAGLNAAFPIRNRARMVDLETGLVRELDAGALQGVSIEHDGRFLTLAELLTLPGAVIVLDVDAAQGPTLQVFEDDGTVQTDVLERHALRGHRRVRSRSRRLRRACQLRQHGRQLRVQLRRWLRGRRARL